MKHFLYLITISSLIFFSACKGQKSLADNKSNATKAADSMVESTDNRTEKSEVEMTKSKMEKEVQEESLSANDLPYEDLENALLWEITGNGLSKESYLYGTIHIIEAESFFWPQNTLDKYQKSDKIVFEIDMDEMSNIGNIFGMMTKIMMNDGMTLSKLLSEEDYAIVNDHFKDIGLPMFMLEKMKPMFLTVFAGGDMDMMGGGAEDSGSKSYEMEFYSLAQEDEKEVLGLETMDDQISLFDSIPYIDQATMLVETIKATAEAGDEGESELEQITKLYLDQNINAMVGSIEEEGSEFQGYEDLFLYNRNRNWIPIMSKYMAEATTFFAVGAGHLAGDQGVIHLLREAGYTLKPLSASSE